MQTVASKTLLPMFVFVCAVLDSIPIFPMARSYSGVKQTLPAATPDRDQSYSWHEIMEGGRGGGFYFTIKRKQNCNKLKDGVLIYQQECALAELCQAELI